MTEATTGNQNQCKLTNREEIAIHQYYCLILGQELVGDMLIVHDILHLEECQVTDLPEALSDRIRHIGDIDELDFIRVVSLAIKREVKFWKPFDIVSNIKGQLYLLDRHHLEESIQEVRNRYVNLKLLFSGRSYQSQTNLLPIKPKYEAFSSKPVFHKTSLGEVVYWGPWNWFLITDIAFSDYMSDLSYSVASVELNGSSEKLLVIQLGEHYECSRDWKKKGIHLKYMAPQDFFNAVVLSWMRAHYQFLKRELKAKRKLML